MMRNSLASLQQRRVSTASAFIREPITANTDDRNWSWKYLRERFRLKDLEALFEQYLRRINHAMLIVYLMVQIFISAAFIVSLCVTKPFTNAVAPEMTAHGVTVIVSFSLLLYVYNERTFHEFPRLHILLSGFVALCLFTIDVAMTLYFQEEDLAPNDYTLVVFGNPIYVILVVYMFLPIQRIWQVVSLAVLLTIGYLSVQGYALGAFTAGGDTYTHTVVRIVIDSLILICVNAVGVYWRFMSEVAFRRAFLDKRGNLESKFKLDAEKKREETLLLSVLPKNIMQQVKADFRNMIDRTLKNTSPVSKRSPFPNLYVHRYEMVSILYADICNFTPLTTKLPVDQLVEMLNELFGRFDCSSETNNCLRIKILGDCYYCVSGVPEYTDEHAHNCLKVGLEMIDIIREVREERSVNVDMRIGIHSGSVLSGLIGVRKWQFDVWSNDVTIANHMEQTGKAGRVHVTHKTRELLADLGYDFIPTDAKEKDALLREEGIDTFLVVPKNKPPANRRASHNYSAVPLKPRVSIPVVSKELKSLYEGDIARKINKVQLPRDTRRTSILSRRRSTHTESAITNSKRRTVVTDSALASFQKIMISSKEFMEKEIKNMPISKYHQWFRPEGINPLFLTFTKEKWELLLLRQSDPLFKFYILGAFILFLCIFTTHQVLMPENTWGWVSGSVCLALFLIGGPLCWVAPIHQHITDPHNDTEYDADELGPVASFFYSTSKRINASFNIRATLFVVICTALYVFTVINLMECKDLLGEHTTTTSLPLTTAYSIDYDTGQLYGNGTAEPPKQLPLLCCSPWYFTYSCIMTLLVAWSFFRMHFIIKLSVYVIVGAVYGYIVFDYAKDLYDNTSMEGVCPYSMVTSHTLSPEIGHLLMVLMIFLVLHIMDRQMEYVMRLDFQWKQNLEEEQNEAQTTHFANKLLLQNILPLHVADMYLNRQNVMDELYHESYHQVGVIFASIPNYSEFYKENEMNEEGKMCLRVLNEIISDFDMLTYNTEFLTMEKIKVVGSTYMAACGLQPGRRYSNESDFQERDTKENVVTITKFAAAMFEKLQKINAEDLQDFRLRVGIDVGPVIAGVVGAHKPMYDIWGNTVNVASRMDYTGEEGKIHVTSDVAKILQDLGWSVECRGEIYVKGKGPMVTYFVNPADVPHSEETTAFYDNNNPSSFYYNHVEVQCDSEKRERRRSSQLSLNSLKLLLNPRRGSLEINKARNSVPLVDSISVLKVIKKLRDNSLDSEGKASSPTSSIRSINDPKSTDDQSPRFQQSSQAEEEKGKLLEQNATILSVVEQRIARPKLPTYAERADHVELNSIHQSTLGNGESEPVQHKPNGVADDHLHGGELCSSSSEVVEEGRINIKSYCPADINKSSTEETVDRS
ncbi:LOW QUALITY PROTEIN: adenylate cyclase type 2-like [Palaemon carinicauda]|uniref:LOW QUALITY PROTEIN: adenylate cyclase type 2-like n=1 Tax=Palaemon carinicauda TaxID=392227 RepID=UPI0035B64576